MIPFKIHFTRTFTIALICVSVLMFVAFADQFPQTHSIERGADKIISLCKDASYRPTCYDLEIPKLMGVLSMEDTFKVTRIIQDTESSYPYCHVLAHFIGGAETAKDPSKWKEVAGRCPTSMCSNGCMHGVFQERFRSDALPDASIKDVSSILGGICEPRGGWNPTSLIQATCTHALGHLTMYVTNANTATSLLICDKISINKNGYDFRPLCYDGVFMQSFQPLEPEDFALVEGKVPSKDKVEEFCSSFSGEERNSCWGESWPLSADFLKESPTNVVSFCGKLSDAGSRKRCVTDMFYILAVQFNLDNKKITDYCVKASGEIRGQCFATASSRLLEVDSRNIDKAVHMCEIAESFWVGDACYNELAAHASYNLGQGSETFLKLCNSLPSLWKERCLLGK